MQTGIVLTTSYSGLGTPELAAHQLAHSFMRECDVLGHHSGVVVHSATEIDEEAQACLLAHSHYYQSGLHARCCGGFRETHIFSDIYDRLENPEPVQHLLAETFKKDGEGCGAGSGLELVRQMRALLKEAKFKDAMPCKAHGTAPRLARQRERKGGKAMMFRALSPPSATWCL